MSKRLIALLVALITLIALSTISIASNVDFGGEETNESIEADFEAVNNECDSLSEYCTGEALDLEIYDDAFVVTDDSYLPVDESFEVVDESEASGETEVAPEVETVEEN